MSNPKAKQLPSTKQKPPYSKPNQPKSPVYKNPAAKPPAAVRQPAKTASGPSRPIGSASRPVPSSAPSVSKSGPPVATKTAAPAQEKSGNWVSQMVQNSVAGVGSYAGGFINSIGGTVNKVGEGIGGQITDRTRGWGQGVAGYGNNIKDAVGVGGPRVATGGNPLGLAGQGSSQNMAKQGDKYPQAVRTGGKGGGANPLGL